MKSLTATMILKIWIKSYMHVEMAISEIIWSLPRWQTSPFLFTTRNTKTVSMISVSLHIEDMVKLSTTPLDLSGYNKAILRLFIRETNAMRSTRTIQKYSNRVSNSELFIDFCITTSLNFIFHRMKCC